MKKINRDLKTSNDVGGLYVKQGRLMNERPDGMTGIQQAAKLRKMKCNSEKAEIIANGISLAEMRENMRDMF